MKLKREAFAACIAEVAAKAALSEDEAWNVIQDVANRGEQLRKQNIGGAFVRAADDLATRERAAAAQNKADAFRNALAVKGIVDRVRSEGGIENAHKTISSMLYMRHGSTSYENVESNHRQLLSRLLGVLDNKLRQGGVYELALKNDLEHEYRVAEHIWQANETKSPVKVSENDPASLEADALRRPLDYVRDRLNALGAHIGDAIDYVGHTNWDTRQLQNSGGPGATFDEGFAEWMKNDFPRMAEKTFEHLTPEEGETMEQAKVKFLRSVYAATRTGVHKQGPHGALPDDGTGYIPSEYEGTSNIARRVSHERVIYWKDAKSWVDHQQQYGGGASLLEQTVRSLSRASRDIALMDKFATNPEAVLNRAIDQIGEDYREHPAQKAFTTKQAAELRNVMGDLTGRLSIPINEDMANLWRSLSSYEASIHLGGVSIPHVVGMPLTLTSELAHHDVPRPVALGKIAEVMSTLLGGRGSAEKQEILADAGAYSRGLLTELNAIQNRRNGIPGMIANAASTLVKYTGIHRALERFQAMGVKDVLMSRLGRDAAKEFAALGPDQQAVMRRYGLHEDEWNLLRSASDPWTEGSQRYVTPSDALNTDKNRIWEILARRGQISADTAPEDIDRAIQKYQWELGDKYGMYLNDAADHAVVTSGVRERRTGYLGLQDQRPGSAFWLLNRSLMQFKMWPLAATHQIFMRELATNLTMKRAAYNIGWIFALGTGAGALRMSINAAISGRPQPDYSDPLTLVEAFAQGGTLGIYGDFLFGEARRMAQDPIAAVLGPVPGEAETALRQIYRHITGTESWDKMWPELARWGGQHIPFGNLMYIKGALDYLVRYHLYETMDPGWWERTNKRLEKEQGHAMAGYVPGGSVPYGVPGIYLTQ